MNLRASWLGSTDFNSLYGTPSCVEQASTISLSVASLSATSISPSLLLSVSCFLSAATSCCLVITFAFMRISPICSTLIPL
ncbi:hypothetical protein MBAV_000920 [Candidatus Magnetobacterium bavaricum]|uniref:Uncharacterized protein n=1 Tax=Candidatus Magnetobacterium bavaricum TaxID=29290 RepID=A0A0F3GYA0_9BACT|nr:hypothetical protein MBAV_000920 [Candidatus Magnetobacterium bavaricum]